MLKSEAERAKIRRMKLFSSLLLLIVLDAVESSDCPVKCKCSLPVVTCTDIASIPDIPSGTEEVFINNSPYLASISPVSNFPVDLVGLFIDKSGLLSVNPTLLSYLTSLETLNITSSCRLNAVDLGENSRHPLRNLSLRNSPMLRNISNIHVYQKLENIDISYCDLQAIEESFFGKMKSLKVLDISHNEGLGTIGRDVFATMDSLEEIHFDNCSLSTLYPEYFDNAYHRNLRFVNGLYNPYQCKTLCDFTKWENTHQRFYDYAYLGSCIEESGDYVYVYFIFTLSYKEAGCPSTVGAVFGVIIGSFIGIILVIFALQTLVNARNRKWWRCCKQDPENAENTSGSETNPTNTTSSSANQAFDPAEDCPSYDAQTGKVTIGNIIPEYEVEPPSYEEIFERGAEAEPTYAEIPVDPSAAGTSANTNSAS